MDPHGSKKGGKTRSSWDILGPLTMGVLKIRSGDGSIFQKGKWLTMADRFNRRSRRVTCHQFNYWLFVSLESSFWNHHWWQYPGFRKARTFKKPILQSAMSYFMIWVSFFRTCPQIAIKLCQIHDFPTIFPAFSLLFLIKRWPFLAARRAVPCGSRSTWCPLRGAEAWTKGCALTPLTPQIHRWIYKKWIHVIYADMVFLNIWLVVWNFFKYFFFYFPRWLGWWLVYYYYYL